MLSRAGSVAAARTALEDPSSLPDLWPMAVEAGWPGLLVPEESGGAGLRTADSSGQALRTPASTATARCSTAMSRSSQTSSGATGSSSWQSTLTRAQSPWRSTPTPKASRCWRSAANDATRNLGHVSFAQARGTALELDPMALADVLVPRPPADRRRIAWRRSDVSRRQRRLREGAPYLRSADRFLPGHQARADRGAPADGERARTAVLRGMGPAVRARGVPARGKCRPLRRVPRSTSPPGR